MKCQILPVIVACIALVVADPGVAGAGTARSLLAELAGLEKEVHSISQMGPDGKGRYTKIVSDLRSRLFRAEDATSEQRQDASRRLSAVSSEIRRKTIDTGRSPSSTRSSSGSSRSSSTFSSSRSRSRSTSRSRSSSRNSSSRSENDALEKVYLAAIERHDDLPKPIFAKSGPLKTEELVALRADIGRFVREYSAALTQWKKDLSAVRREAARHSKDDRTRIRALELVEKRTPEEFRDLVERSRHTLMQHSVGLLNYVRGEYASRERQKDKGQYIIWIGSWDMDKCVQTAWDVADLGIQFEKLFGGSPAIYEQAKKDAKLAAKERAIRLVDRLKTK